jgi:hypothetical protein
MPTPLDLEDKAIGELWRRYTPLRGTHPADLILALIRKLIAQHALLIPYGYWRDRLSHPLNKYGITPEEWNAR